MRISNILLAALFLTAVGSAETFSVTGNESNRTITVKAGDSVSITGNENKIVIKGSCQSIQVTGNENSLDVLDGYNKIGVIGNENNIVVTKLERKKISNLGNGNQITERAAKH